MEILDGKKHAKEIRNQIKKTIDDLIASGKRRPGLAVVIVGSDPASQSYVNSKEKACSSVGMYSRMVSLEASTSEKVLLDHIVSLNDDESIDGILVQLPLPRHMNADSVINCINPDKDVDGFHLHNVGSLFAGRESLVPCTPKGIIRLLKGYSIDMAGKKVCVLGRSNIVGKPVSMLMLQENATVTICHSRTRNPESFTLNSDIIISAVGKAGFLTGAMVKQGAIVVDVGMNVDAAGKLCGDVDFEAVAPKCSFITPVPGGVGPMTIAMLLENTLSAYSKRESC